MHIFHHDILSCKINLTSDFDFTWVSEEAILIIHYVINHTSSCNAGWSSNITVEKIEFINYSIWNIEKIGFVACVVKERTTIIGDFRKIVLNEDNASYKYC